MSDMIQWLGLAALAGLASNGFNIVNRTALRKNGDATAYGWWFEFVRTGFFAGVIWYGGGLALNSEIMWLLVLVSLTELFSVYVFMKMHSLTELSISSVISRMRVIWSPLLAWLLVGERLSLFEYLGIVAIFLGIVIVTSPKQIRSDKGIKIALVFAFSSALLSTVVKKASAVASTELVVMAQGVIPLLVLPFLMKRGVSRIIQSGRTKLLHIFLAGSFNVASSYLLVEAMRLTDVSKVVGVYQAMTLLAVLYGILILRETDKLWHKIIGTIIVIVGIVIMALPA